MQPGRSLTALVCGSLLLVACSGRLNGETMSEQERYDAAWQAVTAAGDPREQRRQIDAFLALNQQADAPALQVLVSSLDTGQRAPIDRALWDNPQRYEVTLRYGERSYVFVPQSADSLKPLFRE